MNNQKIHESVMVVEVLKHIKKLGKYIDATLGTGGHTLEIAKKSKLVLGIEADPEMLEIAKNRLKSSENVVLVNGNFVDIDKIAKENNFDKVDGILMDLGVTNLHLLDENRGFSFSNSNLNTELDMRLDQNKQGVKAKDLLNMLREDQLQKLFDTTLDRSSSRWLSSQVIKRRSVEKFETVSDFLDICERIRNEKVHLHPATLPFLALRIAVNSELDNLVEVLPKAYDLLKVGGKLLVITFHSKEDEIVKSFDKKSQLEVPSSEEVLLNARARSAKLRVITKL